MAGDECLTMCRDLTESKGSDHSSISQYQRSFRGQKDTTREDTARFSTRCAPETFTALYTAASLPRDAEDVLNGSEHGVLMSTLNVLSVHMSTLIRHTTRDRYRWPNQGRHCSGEISLSLLSEKILRNIIFIATDVGSAICKRNIGCTNLYIF